MVDQNKIHVCYIGPFNPASCKDYLDEKDVLPLNKTLSQLDTLVKAFLSNGHCVTVITEDVTCKEDRKYTGDSLTVYVVGTKKYALSSIIKLRFFVSRKIRKVINLLTDVDVYHAQWTYEYAYPLINKDGLIFCTVRDWAPYIYTTFHLKPFTHYIAKKLIWLPKLYMNKKVLANNKIHLVANSEYTANRIHSRFPDRDVPIIYNAIHSDKIDYTTKPHYDDLVFISVSPSLDNQRKNIPPLVEAFRKFHVKHPKSKLILVGTYHPDRGVHLMCQGDDLKDCITFTGTIDNKELLSLLSKSSCLIHPALEETFGNTLIEAMSRRVPVIAGENSGSVPYVLKHGECGVLCDVTSPDSIYDSMEMLYEHPDKVNQLVEAATIALINDYTEDALYKKHYSIYSKYLNK